MNRPYICKQIEGIEIPSVLAAIASAAAVDPVNVPVSIVALDPIGGAIAGGSVSLWALKRYCDNLEEENEESDVMQSDLNNYNTDNNE